MGQRERERERERETDRETERETDRERERERERWSGRRWVSVPEVVWRGGGCSKRIHHWMQKRNGPQQQHARLNAAHAR